MDTVSPRTLLQTIGLLTLSNLFMTFAWYGHLRTMKDSPWWTAALLSWGIALAEYLLMLSTNRVKYAEFFWWRKFYDVRVGERSIEHRAQASCELCRKLNDPDEPPKTYRDMNAWWIGGGHCLRWNNNAFS